MDSHIAVLPSKILFPPPPQSLLLEVLSGLTFLVLARFSVTRALTFFLDLVLVVPAPSFFSSPCHGSASTIWLSPSYSARWPHGADHSSSSTPADVLSLRPRRGLLAAASSPPRLLAFTYIAARARRLRMLSIALFFTPSAVVDARFFPSCACRPRLVPLVTTFSGALCGPFRSRSAVVPRIAVFDAPYCSRRASSLLSVSSLPLLCPFFLLVQSSTTPQIGCVLSGAQATSSV